MRAKTELLDNGILVIKMDYEMAKAIRFGCMNEGKHILVCNSCNEIIDEDIYFIPVLYDCYCKECFDGLNNGTLKKHYKSDMEYEYNVYFRTSLSIMNVLQLYNLEDTYNLIEEKEWLEKCEGKTIGD